MSDPKPIVWEDEHGAMRVGRTRVLYQGIIYGLLQGESPETLQEGYPALTLAEVNEAIAYYLSHKEEAEAYLRRQEEVLDYWRKKIDEDPPPFRERLRTIKRAFEEEDS